jgi:hypothetical protein
MRRKIDSDMAALVRAIQRAVLIAAVARRCNSIVPGLWRVRD